MRLPVSAEETVRLGSRDTDEVVGSMSTSQVAVSTSRSILRMPKTSARLAVLVAKTILVDVQLHRDGGAPVVLNGLGSDLVGKFVRVKVQAEAVQQVCVRRGTAPC